MIVDNLERAGVQFINLIRVEYLFHYKDRENKEIFYFEHLFSSHNFINKYFHFQYKGEWFEQARYVVPFQADDGKCVKPIYGDLTDTSITVNNTQILPADNDQWKMFYLTGQGVQVDVS